MTSDEHQERLRTSKAAWLKQRALLERFRVRPGDRRTTPPPPYDIAKEFPELAGLSATTIRLHPRYGEDPPVDASKIGGTFLWPQREQWPVCEEHGIPLVTVLQLRASDFPEMPFPACTNIFQLLWCPREHHRSRHTACQMMWADPRFYWRRAEEITHPRPDNPPPQDAYYEYVPFTCRLLPERVIEYPSVYELPDDLVERIYAWENAHLTAAGVHECEYESELSVCPGTKIGGHPWVIQSPWNPTCACGEFMDLMLTIETVEWNGFICQHWTPQEDKAILASLPARWENRSQTDKDIFHALWNPTGLSLGDAGHMQLFVCRSCASFPIVPKIECS